MSREICGAASTGHYLHRRWLVAGFVLAGRPHN
nr:MAG TPA_asm: hypothetical protein [Caudoviricetes sp.]